MLCFAAYNIVKKIFVKRWFAGLPVSLLNYGLISNLLKISLTSWGEGAPLSLVGNPSSDGVMIKISNGVDILHRPTSYPIFSYWVG